MPTGLYPGKGQQLYRARSATAGAAETREPVWLSPGVADPTIPSGSCTLGMPLNAGITTSINVVYGTAPSGTAFNIMYSAFPDFTSEYVYQAVATVASQKTYTYSTAAELDGFFRVTNAGGQDITGAWLQQRATNYS